MASERSEHVATVSAAENATMQVSTLQAELVALKAEMVARVASLEDTTANLAQENALLKRRMFGNRTERSHTSELQLALGDLLAGEAKLQQELADAVGKVDDALGKDDDAAGNAEGALGPEPKPPAGPRATPRGRRDLSASTLPRVMVEILDPEREASGCRRIGFEDSMQLMFRRGGFSVLVKHVARYEVIQDGEATVIAAPGPETLFPRALLHTSAVAHVLTSKFALGHRSYPRHQARLREALPVLGLLHRVADPLPCARRRARPAAPVLLGDGSDSHPAGERLPG